MRLSTRGRYASRALLDLALHEREGHVLLKDIARRQEISKKYLEQLMTPLIVGGIVQATRGPKGGVSLARPPGEIKLSEIIRLVEGSMAPVACVDDPTLCTRSDLCVTRDIWGEVKEAIEGVLDSKTLQDMIELQRQKEQSKEPMYYV